MSLRRPQSRLDPRVAVRLKGCVFGASSSHPEIEVATLNLSMGGALCESNVTIPLGIPVRLRLDVTNESGSVHPLVVEAIPLRVEGSGPFIVALHFVGPPDRILDLLRRFLLRSLQAGVP
jgi:hypothetical protein